MGLQQIYEALTPLYKKLGIFLYMVFVKHLIEQNLLDRYTVEHVAFRAFYPE